MRHLPSVRTACLGIGVTLLLLGTASPQEKTAREKPQDDGEQQVVSGEADVLRRIPKTFAMLVQTDPAQRQVTLRVEGEDQVTTWPVKPDAAVRVHAWWGRLEQFSPERRVWVWFDIDRNEEPRSVLLLADEISEQAIHSQPATVQRANHEEQTLTLKSASDGERGLQLPESLRAESTADFIEFTAAETEALGGTRSVRIRPGSEVFIQTAGRSLLRLIPVDRLDAVRKRQQAMMFDHWTEYGLPGTVTFLHPLAGEMEVMLDHSAMRWGRSLKVGAEVTLKTEPPVQAAVKLVEPWREKTRLRLVTASGLDQADLSPGQRIRLEAPQPSAAVLDAQFPAGLHHARTKQHKVEWFLSSLYCPCRIGGDRCTGMFYTQAACNANACPMFKTLAGEVSRLLDQGQTDRQVFEHLREVHGSKLLQPHLLE